MTPLAAVIPANPQGLRRWLYGPSGLRAGWRLLIFLAILIALYAAKAWLLRALLPTSDEIAQYLANKLLQFLAFLLATWLMAKLEGLRIGDYGLPWRRMFRGRFWQGIALGFAFITALLGALRLAGVFHFGTITRGGVEAWAYAGFYAVAFLLIGLEEEFRYRGYALRTLTSGIGFWPAAILTAALFGYSHLGNRGETWAGAVNAGVGGLFFCLLVRRTGDLWMAIGFHTAWNWGEAFFYGVPDSGYTVPGHLFDPSFSGPAWLTGGSVGPEGSLFCTLLIAVVAVVVAAWLRETRYPLPFADPS
jgi:membrane protease YdiL (CAAX protease family)